MQIKRQTGDGHSNAYWGKCSNRIESGRSDCGHLEAKHTFGNRHLAAVPLQTATHRVLEIKATRRRMIQGYR